MSRSIKQLGWPAVLAVLIIVALCRPVLGGDVPTWGNQGSPDIPSMGGDTPPGGGDSGDPDEFGIYAAPIDPSHDSITRHPMPPHGEHPRQGAPMHPIEGWKLFLIQLCARGI